MTDFKTDEIEQLLQQGFVKPPPTFSHDVMAAVRSQANEQTLQLQQDKSTYPTYPHFLRVGAQVVALAIASVVGISQALAFVLSLWITSVAG